MIGFRVDANENIASGHIVRCITIAREFVKLGQECVFYLAEDKETWRLDEQNFKYTILNSEWNNLNNEREKLKNIIINDELKWLIVDSYQADSEYLAYLNNYCKVAYIDDMALFKCDISAVIHYGLQDNEYDKKYIGTRTLCLSGTEYIPLREEFSNNNQNIRRNKSILVTTGATDKYDVTQSFLNKFIDEEIFGKYDVYVIIGSMNMYEEDIRKFAKSHSRIHMLKNISNISQYMKKCEYAVSAGGTTLYELCACNTPTVCFSFADNQYEFAKRMEKEELMLYAGDPRFNGNIGGNIVNCLIKMKNDFKLVVRNKDNMRKLIDGNGASRIADILLRY